MRRPSSPGRTRSAAKLRLPFWLPGKGRNYSQPKFRNGVNGESVSWSFSAALTHLDPHADYWRPLSYLSHAVDIELFGLRPSGHHLMSLGIHAAACVALFLVLQSMTGERWRAAF